MEIANHYGNMRFAMFTVFTAIVGTLLVFAFSPDHKELLNIDFNRKLFCTVGFVLSLLFGLSQHRISYLVTYYQEAAFDKDLSKKPKGHECWVFVAGLTMLSPYIFSGFLWIFFAFGVVKIV